MGPGTRQAIHDAQARMNDYYENAFNKYGSYHPYAEKRYTARDMDMVMEMFRNGSVGSPVDVVGPPPAPPRPPHVCKKKTNERHRNYLNGIIDFHRKRGKVDVSKLETECKAPACLLGRITTLTAFA